jgi:hypothetical protein
MDDVLVVDEEDAQAPMLVAGTDRPIEPARERAR